LAREGELPLACFELRFETAELVFSLLPRVVAILRLGRDCLERVRPSVDVTCASLEPIAFLLELDPAGGELLLDAACVLCPLLELRALGARELSLRQRLVQL
jgi:hypothetical protein